MLLSGPAVPEKRDTSDPAPGALYDFGQAIKLSPDQKYQVDEQMNTLCSLLSRTLGVYLNTEVNLVIESTTEATYKEYVANLPSSIIAAAFELSPYSPPATWQIDTPVAYAIIDCMTGGTGQESAMPDREATTLEAVMIGQFCAEMLTTWSTAGQGLKPDALEVQEVITTIGRLEHINAAQEQNYSAVIRASVAGAEGCMNISMPASALQPLLQRRKQETIDKDIRPMVMEVVGRATIPIKVTFGEHEKSLNELSQLREGSMIDLEHYVDDPFVVSIAGRPKFLGQSGVERGRLAVKLTAVITG